MAGELPRARLQARGPGDRVALVRGTARAGARWFDDLGRVPLGLLAISVAGLVIEVVVALTWSP